MHGALHHSGIQKSFSLLQVGPKHDGEAIRHASDIKVTKTDLKNGDLLRVFKSITKAETLIDSDIDLEMDRKYYQEYQKGMDKGLWSKLFSLRLPARLTKADGTIIDGVLEPFTEQGMEGHVAWSVFDFDNNSYASLHMLEKGDHLTVFSRVLEGEIEWQGHIELEEKPFATGKDITLVSYDRDEDEESITNIKMRQVPEVIAKTYKTPPLEALEGWSLRNLPAQLLH